jgi:ribosomal protein S1
LQFSIKRLVKDPWSDIEKKYPKDSPIEGTVTQVTNFGALVKFEPGIEGLIHVSKIPPQVKVSEGEKISCFVERIDKENRRLSLELAMTQKPLIYK